MWIQLRFSIASRNASREYLPASSPVRNSFATLQEKSFECTLTASGPSSSEFIPRIKQQWYILSTVVFAVVLAKQKLSPEGLLALLGGLLLVPLVCTRRFCFWLFRNLLLSETCALLVDCFRGFLRWRWVPLEICERSWPFECTNNFPLSWLCQRIDTPFRWLRVKRLRLGCRILLLGRYLDYIEQRLIKKFSNPLVLVF